MNILLWASAVLLAVDLVLIAVAAVWATPPVQLPIPDLIVGAGVLVAMLALSLDRRQKGSEAFLNSSLDLLQKAYETLRVDADAWMRPPNDRLTWLAAARFLRASEKISSQITEESHRIIYREQREYWRQRFYELIFPSIDAFPKEYYGGADAKPNIELSEKSLAVLYRFVTWPPDYEDPVNAEPLFSEEEISKMCAFGPRGLGDAMFEKRRRVEKKESRTSEPPEGDI